MHPLGTRCQPSQGTRLPAAGVRALVVVAMIPRLLPSSTAAVTQSVLPAVEQLELVNQTPTTQPPAERKPKVLWVLPVLTVQVPPTPMAVAMEMGRSHR
ncbi:hypothetical protein BD779DRAFT_1528102, partial [Infundibulicybe gibba]